MSSIRSQSVLDDCCPLQRPSPRIDLAIDERCLGIVRAGSAFPSERDFEVVLRSNLRMAGLHSRLWGTLAAPPHKLTGEKHLDTEESQWKTDDACTIDE